MSILEGLNPQQLEAVTLPHQSALILAGAGSGKTRVLTTRIAWLIQTGQIGPLSVMAVTFTNKAAREMLTRISAMLPINTRGMWVGTFHGLCNRILRAHYREAGLPQTFQILDSADQLAVIKRVMKAMNVDDEKYPPRQAQGFINSAKEQGLRAAQVDAPDDFSRRLLTVYEAYEAQCNREGVVDFAELLLRCYELLGRNELLRDHYRGRFKHILVDEFQDTNRLQYHWLKLLAGPSNTIFAVGDDDQAIYAFRGAHAGNMLDLERDFRIEKVIKLEQNYRSHGNILDAANALIRHNRTRLGKNLWTSEGSGEPLRVSEAMTDVEEAAFILDEVRQLHNEGVALSDMALLYRSNAQSRVLEHALFNAGISYRVYGGLRFFERQEIKHALAYLRLAANPDDDSAFLRVVNFPTRGIGNRSLEQLQEAAARRGISLWRAACANTLSGKAAASIAAFIQFIEAMRKACENLPLPEVVDHVVATSGLIAHYQTEREGADRIENLNELTNAAAAFVGQDGPITLISAEGEIRSEGLDPLNAFLAHAALEAGEHQAGEGTDALQLMTVHSAKGLEFHTVFISGLEEGLFPHENSLSEQHGLEEERRLMYVALTRARRRLYLSHAQTRLLHGQTRYNVRSRFFEELPDELLKRINTTKFSGFVASKGYGAGSEAGAPGWRVGQNVVHPKFGVGVIVNAEGRGSDARVQVNFRDAGLKWLALDYAKLVPA
ncbi:MAG TPA: UvrD-helicase domain-containing protein [Burkholderiales bacterium]|jgi:DNA helicase-2/ATP-dependent DNA helicase PcrA|nr:UvrD-helicase domain-containing protein [Burkholderiales bacterium]